MRQHSFEGLPSPDAAGDSMLSVFGNCEMEQAARALIAIARRHKTWSFDFGIDDVEFRDCRVGLFLLALNGWLVAWYPTPCTRLSRGFVERVTSDHAKRYDGEHATGRR